jgi:hypothetical protein
MFIEEKVYNHMTKIAEQWWQMVIAEKNNTRQVISPQSLATTRVDGE